MNEGLESFVVRLYGINKKINLDNARYKLIRKKLDNVEKSIDMGSLPPCASIFCLHCERANYLACIWKRATMFQCHFPDVFFYRGNCDKWIK